MCPLQRRCIRKFFNFSCLIILTGALFFKAPVAVAGEKVLPFSIGEKLSYSVSWEMIPAGKASFSVLDFPRTDGKNGWQFVLDVKSNRYIDFLYKIRDHVEGFADKSMEHSFFYKKNQSGKDKKQIEVVFDWEKNTATYSNYGGKHDPLPIPLSTLDPLSAFYKMRLLDFGAIKDLSFSITDGKKQFLQKGEVIRKETIYLSSGTYETYVLVPEVNNFSGVFEKSKDPSVNMWITTDQRRIPVRITVKVFIGSVIFELDSMN